MYLPVRRASRNSLRFFPSGSISPAKLYRACLLNVSYIQLYSAELGMIRENSDKLLRSYRYLMPIFSSHICMK